MYNHSNKPVILVVYDYFFPGYKAGGPVQSLVNMITSLSHQYNFKVITYAYDLGETQPYANLATDQWTNVTLAPDVQVECFYASKAISRKLLVQLVVHAHPSIIYVNGIFSRSLFLGTLLAMPRIRKKVACRLVVCPRGMMQQGALAVKSGKKKIYLTLLTKSRLLRNIIWHATTQDELNDIHALVGRKALGAVAGNIPKKPLQHITQHEKKQGLLRLVYLSLITEKKNLHLLLQVLQSCTATVELHIYGPVKDVTYWQQCQKLMAQVPKHITVTYHGDVEPARVQTTIAQYDAFILLTKGENFGHALYESFSVGRPVITSYFTPWNNLQQQQAGWNVDIQNTASIAGLLNELADQENTQWHTWCANAHNVALSYYHSQDFVQDYRPLFNT